MNQTRHIRETRRAVTNPSLEALVGSILAVVLVPVAVTYLAGHLALGVGFLIGIGLAQLLSRLNGWEANADQQSNPGRSAEPSVLFEGLDGQQAPTTTSSD